MKHLFLLLTLLSFSLTALAQQKVTGKVKDSSGEPVIGASVVVKGNNTMGTITDFDGNFMLDVPTKCIGYFLYWLCHSGSSDSRKKIIRDYFKRGYQDLGRSGGDWLRYTA